jgi:DNA (cytosine-5)-methyltransferase 1
MRCVDLFAGCGGFSLGFEKAGFDIVGAIDNWSEAVHVYKQNFSHPIYELDLNHLDNIIPIIEPLKPDIIIGGPPCQDFSSAGKRDTSLGRAALTYSFQEIVSTIKPNYFVMENVDLILKSHIFSHIIEYFHKSDYGLTAVILDASYCGVPQKRNRFFLIGGIHEKNNFLLDRLYKDLASNPLTVKEHFEGNLEIEYYYRHPRNYNRRGIFSVNEPSPTIRGVNRPIPPNYMPNHCDPQNISLDQIRPLTTLERAKIQTFPDTFHWKGTKTNLEQMIGNAVPVNLAHFIGKNLLNHIQREETTASNQLILFEEQLIIPSRPLHKQYNSLYKTRV